MIHGTFLGIKHMKAANKGEGGLIINVGSMSGKYHAPYRRILRLVQICHAEQYVVWKMQYDNTHK